LIIFSFNEWSTILLAFVSGIMNTRYFCEFGPSYLSLILL